MRTHGCHFLESDEMVFHFFGVSYDKQSLESKRKRCLELLETLKREREQSPAGDVLRAAPEE
jgi:hypothetical protein